MSYGTNSYNGLPAVAGGSSPIVSGENGATLVPFVLTQTFTFPDVEQEFYDGSDGTAGYMVDAVYSQVLDPYTAATPVENVTISFSGNNNTASVNGELAQAVADGIVGSSTIVGAIRLFDGDELELTPTAGSAVITIYGRRWIPPTP